MWVPAGVIFILFGLALLAAWFGEAERRVRFGATDSTARRLLLLMVAISLAASGCQGSTVREAEVMTGGRVARGHAAIVKYGCGACHTIPRVSGANATVGPPLERMARRSYLGGHLTNTPPTSPDGFSTPRSRSEECHAGPRSRGPGGQGYRRIPLHAAQTMDELPAQVPG